MQEEFKLFPSRQAVEALCAWSDSLKSFQGRIGKYFARSEAKTAAFDYIQAKLVSSGTKKWLADGRTSRTHQSLSLATLIGESALGIRNRFVPR